MKTLKQEVIETIFWTEAQAHREAYYEVDSEEEKAYHLEKMNFYLDAYKEAITPSHIRARKAFLSLSAQKRLASFS